MSEDRDSRPRPSLFVLLSVLAVATFLAGCPDDVASTDLAQPKDQAVASPDLGDLGGKD